MKYFKGKCSILKNLFDSTLSQFLIFSICGFKKKKMVCLAGFMACQPCKVI